MNRHEIINTIGVEFLSYNIENQEFSYEKALKKQGKNYKDYLIPGSKKHNKNIDLRFVDGRLSILVETKTILSTQSTTFIEHIEQLQNYIQLEKELTGNKIIAILSATTTSDVFVWLDGSDCISLENVSDSERQIKDFIYYQDIYFGTKNDRLKIIQNTYLLNELLHQHGINEKIRSQFVGTCLLALKNHLNYQKSSVNQIRAGIEEILTNLLNQDLNKAEKLVILKNKVIDSQDVRDLSIDAFIHILNTINEQILPYINDKNTAGQDLLNLFFTTFNKYVGKSDKNQAFTPDHIVHFMCRCLEVNKNSVVLDPCCGSGAFLVRALTDAMDDADTEYEKNQIKSSQIYGIEYEEGAFGLATTNMLIHGDGNSNILQGSCFDKIKYILTKISETKGGKAINTILMNPPYNAQKKHCPVEYTQTWNSDTKEDPSKGFYFVYETAKRVKTGKLAVLLPVQCAIGGKSKEIQRYKKKMLEEHSLLAVFSLPDDMFHPGANASACCMIFELGVKHSNDKSTFFGYFKDDAFQKKKNFGRVEKKDSSWNEVEKKWLNLFRNKKEQDGLSVMCQVSSEDEWLAEAYMKTDYSVLTMSHFEKTVREYASFLLKINKISVIQSDLTRNNAQLSFDTYSWRPFTIETLFGTPTSTRGTTTDELVEGDDIPYIAAKKESNGLDLLCSQSENQDFISTGNCIVFIQLGHGSAGYSLYQGYDFIGMNGKTSCGYNKNLNKWNGLFLVTVLDLERYRYSYGRSWTGKRLKDTEIMLPALIKEDGTYEPDWDFMTSYIQSLKYANLL